MTASKPESKPELIQTAADVRIAATRVGEGPTVLLNGGLGMPAGVWQFTGVPAALVEAGFSVITYSARGLVPSSAPPAPYSVPEMADDAAAVLGHFGVDDAVIAGYSMGCYISQVLASSWPGRIRGLAMIAGLRSSAIGEMVNEMELGLIERLGEIPEAVAVFEQLMTTLGPGMLGDDLTVRAWREVLTAGEPVWASPDGLKGQLSASHGWMLAKEPTPERLAAIDVPALVVAYQHDVFFPPSGSREAASHMPIADFHELDGLAHGGLMLDPDRRATALLVEFCRKVTAS
ncbi:alpha/beta hydrolase [Gordonia cholesterolivorans]|uniref:Alpha/beta hydrolase n=1 Tax=Gordonia cholesterolivorans TaxID=559625 RepID=A0ABP5UZF5_9ACTN